MAGPGCARAVEDLASRLVRAGADASQLESARVAAQGMLELEHVRRIEVALIERGHAFGRLEPRKLFRTKKDETAWVAQYFLGATLGNIRPKCAVDTLPPMPEEEPPRTAEAVRRVLPELLRLARYEARAFKRRDRAIQTLVLRCVESQNAE
jgi:hypothetical protein